VSGIGVVVTGIGTVNALGAGGRAALAAALDSGRSAVGPLRAFDTGAPGRWLAAEVDDAAVTHLLDPDAARRLSRLCRLGVAACRLAVADAAVEPGDDLGLVVGTEHGDFRSSVGFLSGYLARGVGGLSPMIFPSTVMNTVAAVATIAVAARGPSITVNEATVAGDLAVARGAALIRAGRARAVVAGGADELYEPVHRQLARLGALSPAGGGSGPVPGEGATFVVLERRADAEARGAPVLAEVRDAAWGVVPAAPHTARPRRADGRSPVSRLLASGAVREAARCYGSANGDALLDDWERALLRHDLGGGAPALLTPVALAGVFGQHGGIGALRVAAAALAAARGAGAALVHGIARGGCRTALLVGAPA
jgi:3-oxoacyl-[acyl-carrier-protein] synthase II